MKTKFTQKPFQTTYSATHNEEKDKKSINTYTAHKNFPYIAINLSSEPMGFIAIKLPKLAFQCMYLACVEKNMKTRALFVVHSMFPDMSLGSTKRLDGTFDFLGPESSWDPNSPICFAARRPH